MGSIPPAAAFAAVYACTALRQIDPGLVIILQVFAAILPVADFPLPYRHRAQFRVLVGPGCLVVGNDARPILPAALGNIQVGNFGDDRIAHVVAVGNYQMAGIDTVDGFRRRQR